MKLSNLSVLSLYILNAACKSASTVSMVIRADGVPHNMDIVLYSQETPLTAKNFIEHCRDNYAGVPFHRVIPGFMAQGGDYENRNGTGGKVHPALQQPSEYFANEDSIHKHSRRGMLSMANRGPGTNGSQFFILFDKFPHLDGLHPVFGHITPESMPALDAIEAASKSGGKSEIISCKPTEDSDAGNSKSAEL